MALTPADGNTVWGATDPDDGHVEFHSVATWLGFSAYRAVRIRATQSAHTTALAQLLALHGGSVQSVEAALAAIEDSYAAAAERGARAAMTASLLSRVEAAEHALHRWGGKNEARDLLDGLTRDLRASLAAQAADDTT